MRVLMFGWEFPPHIAGGLGTACYGIVKGLAYNGVQTLFVMPSASGDEDQSAAKIINASDVPVESFDSTVDEFLDKVKFVRIGSNMIPYVDPEEFHAMVEYERRLHSENLTKGELDQVNTQPKLTFTVYAVQKSGVDTPAAAWEITK